MNNKQNVTFPPDGPLVLLGNSNSLFPKILAQEWVDRGWKVALVTATYGDEKELIKGVPILRSQDFRRSYMRWVRAGNPVLRFIERTLPKLYRKHYQRKTGRTTPEPIEWYWVDQFWDSFSLARAALSLNPRFVFGHEASSYGLGTVLCKNVPQIIFPWGGDIFSYVESSPAINWITTYALKNADLIIPSSTTAAQYIPKRFNVSEEKVHAVSWGVDVNKFKKATREQRQEICARYRINPASTILLNARRFIPMWGAFEVLDAFIQIASTNKKYHCILFGGAETQEHTKTARTRIQQAGLSSQFTLFEGNIPLEECAQVMSVSDLFLSLLVKGDMRSFSVLQAAASGGVPVILENPEYRSMTEQGFQAKFVPSLNSEQIVQAISSLLDDQSLCDKMRVNNNRFLNKHENFDVQMDKILQLTEQVVREYGK